MVVESAYIPARMQHPSKYVGELRQIIGYYVGWVANEYASNTDEDNMYAVIDNDDAVKGSLDQLALMAAGINFYIKCPSQPLLEKILNLAIGEMRKFNITRKSLVSKSFIYGLALHQKYYDRIKFDGIPGEWLTCIRTQNVDRRRLRIEREISGPEGFNKSYWTIYQPEYDAYIILRDRGDGENYALGSCVQDYIWFSQDEEELYPYFKGAADILFPLCYAKMHGYQYWSEFCEFWSNPQVYGRMDLKQGIFSGVIDGVANQNQRGRNIYQEFRKMRKNNIFVAAGNDEIKLLQSGSVGVNVDRELVEYVDARINLYIMGSSLTTSTSEKSGYSADRIHLSQSELKGKDLRKSLSEVLLDDLIFDFIYKNRVNLFALGIRVPNRSDIEFIYSIDSGDKGGETKNNKYYDNKLDKKDNGLGG